MMIFNISALTKDVLLKLMSLLQLCRGSTMKKMTDVSQKGNSWNTNINFKAKAGYFFSGLVLPVIAGLIPEFIKTGKTSELLAKILPF